MFRSRRVLLAFVGVLIAGVVHGGVFIEQKVHSDALVVDGKTRPAKDELQRTWLDNDKMAVERPGVSTVIVRLDQGRLYLVNHAKRTWSAIKLPLQFPPEVARVFNGLRFQTQIRRTGEKAQVGPYSCEKVEVRTSGYLNAEITHWCSSAVPVPVDQFYALSAQVAAFSPALAEMNQKLRGLGNLFPVRSETRLEVFGAKSRTVTDLIKVDPKALIPAERFAPPVNYLEEPVDFSPLIRR